MAQIFHPSANSIARITLFGAIFILAALGKMGMDITTSPYITEINVPREQPVPFSHKHHVQGVGIDCRYCHTSVETSSFAGIPPTKTCMNCHSQIWSESPMLAPVRESLDQNKPIQWTRVHDLPDFVYFDHSIHINKGIGCESCHGRVDQMPLTARANTLLMSWCLECHRNPERFVRPKDQVYTMGYKPAEDQKVLGEKLVKQYHIQKMTSCSVCHR